MLTLDAWGGWRSDGGDGDRSETARSSGARGRRRRRADERRDGVRVRRRDGVRWSEERGGERRRRAAISAAWRRVTPPRAMWKGKREGGARYMGGGHRSRAMALPGTNESLVPGNEMARDR